MKKNIRVLTIAHMFPSEALKRHGIFMVRQAGYLAEHNIECDFLVARPWAPWPLSCLPRWKDYGVSNPLLTIENIKARAFSYIRPPGSWFRAFEYKLMAMAMRIHTRQWHRKEPFDLVLGVPMIPDAQCAAVIGEDLNLPVATLAIGSDVMVYPEEMPVLWKQLKKTLQKVDLPVGVSESICSKLSETGSCKRTPLCVYLGRDDSLFSPAADKNTHRKTLKYEEDDIIAIYVGKVADSKGIDELVAASEEMLIKHTNFKLVCLGNGPAISKLIELQKRIGRKDSVILPGHVEPEKVPVFLQASDFLVFPSHSEGMPQAVLEAMNCGLAVVATRVGGIPEAVIDGETGILIDVKNVEQLKKAMSKMVADKEFRVSAGRKGYELVNTKFDAKRNASKFADALWSLV